MLCTMGYILYGYRFVFKLKVAFYCDPVFNLCIGYILYGYYFKLGSTMLHLYVEIFKLFIKDAYCMSYVSICE